MRVISGTLGGRQFDAPRGHRTHPMSDKARGGLFNALGDLSGMTVLDAFAGSGALTFEAISHGATSAVAIDIDKNAHQTIQANINKLGIADKVKAIRANASGWSDNNPSAYFDIVIAAPPYDDLQPSIVSKMANHVRGYGMFILDYPSGTPPPELPNLKLVKHKEYGDATLYVYRVN